jgi:hypothetical protein
MVLAKASTYLENVSITGRPFNGVTADGSNGNRVQLTTRILAVARAANAAVYVSNAAVHIHDSVLRTEGSGYGLHVQSTTPRADSRLSSEPK